MAQYRKKSDIVDAFQWTGDENPEWAVAAMLKEQMWFKDVGTPAVRLMMKSPHGTKIARPGDYVVKGPLGNIFPVSADIFHMLYEAI